MSERAISGDLVRSGGVAGWDWELEAREQMAAKLEAQMALQAIVAALDLDFASLGNGWTAATAKILARVEEIVDEAERAFRERDEALRQIGRNA